jgi:hypothetical protein
VRAEPQYEGKFQWMARFGFLVRGLLYIVIALLVIGAGRTEDLTGAMEYLSRGIGHWLLALMVAGMVGYGLWRVSDAAFGMDSGTAGAKALRHRAAAGASGAIYLFLAYKAVRILLGDRADASGPQENASTALHLPNGALILGIAAAVAAGAGLVQLYKAGTCSFLRHLDDRARQTMPKWLGRIGYGARGVIFLTVGYLVARAALDRSAAEAGGLEQALDALSPPLEYAVAAGLMLFGAYSMVEARYRAIHRPPVERIEQEVREKLPR